MQHSSPRQFKNHIPPPTNYHTHREIGTLPLVESSYHGKNQPPTPFHEGLNPSDRSWSFYRPWQTPHVEYIADEDVQPSDVLSGRGGATNSHSGNRVFRMMVKQHQRDYLKAKKRDKPQVAARVVDKIRKKGGRFLRRYPTKSGPMWADIGDHRAKEKTCQALREGAPEIRRRKATADMDGGRKYKDSDGSISATSTFDRMDSDEDNKPPTGGRTQILRTNFEAEKKEAVSVAGASMVIQPSMALLCSHQYDKPLAIPIDHLDEQGREMYLRYFLPPNPSIQKNEFALRPTIAAPAVPTNKNGRMDEWGTDSTGGRVVEL